MEIIPAILPKNFDEIEEKTLMVKGLVDFVQVDICDGKFVPSVTWPYKKKDEDFEDIIQEKRGMPLWEDIDYEFDLMIKDPTEHDARQWLSAGATRIVLHAESSPDLTLVIAVLYGLVEIGLSLNIQTPLNVIDKYIDKISYIQFMGITKVGFQGQAFDPRVLTKIEESKERYSSLPVQVDGGISLATARDIEEAGAERLVAGSAIFESENPAEIIRKFKSI